jgi:thiopeptide-type bacteriocin biosynthesis protein
MKQTERTFIPGSKWLYIKIYTGTKTADNILIQDISFIIHLLYKKSLIEKWFFIRYSDMDFHLRIRILLKEESYIGDVLSLFYSRLNPLIKESLVWKIQLDTYNRELERYGGGLIEEAESIFCIDSECIISIIKKIRHQDENYRWMIALKMIDNLLSDFSLNLASKQELMSELSFS